MAENDSQHPATKGDLAAVKSDIEQLNGKIGLLDGKIGRLDEKIGRLDEKIGRLDEKIDSSTKRLDEKIDTVRSELKTDIHRLEEIGKTNTIDILHIKEDISGIRETMATKDDINRVMNSIDRFAGEYISYRNRDILRGDEIVKHGDKLDDHEARLHKLETKQA